MKLFMAAASPYVRKVRVLAHETGIIGKIDLVEVAVTPTSPLDDLNASNPIGKIPALVLDDGSTIYDSRTICEYLDTEHAGGRMIPASGPARWTALRRHAMADGLLDAAILTRYETFLRPENLRWSDWIDAQKGKINRVLAGMESEVDDLPAEPNMASIAFACAVSYLDFRFGEDDWRSPHPKLAAWFKGFEARPSMQATKPE